MDSSAMRMGNFKPKQSIPSFYWILLHETLAKKQIPDAFMKKLLLAGVFSSNAVFLETHSGRKWRVEIENDGDTFYFRKGWLAFVRGTKTRRGDLLAFCLINSSTFKVSIFGPGGCEKDLNPTRKSHCERGKNVIIEIEDDDDDDDDDDEEEEEEEQGEGEGEGEEEEDYDGDNGREMHSMEDIQNPIIRRRIGKTHCKVMSFPRKFVSESEIGSERETVLRNKEGKEWSVGIRCRHGRFFLQQSGFKNFFKDNELVEGDLCTFQYIYGDGVRDSFIKFEIVEYGARRA